MNTRESYCIERFEKISSTNDYAKEKRSEGKNLLVFASSQTGGRGTKGRSFSSDIGGLYFTALSFYENFPASQAFTIMQGVAAAVCKTLTHFGLQPKIKWPNDIFVNGKKICGILIENAFSGSEIRSSVVGVGLNICNELPAELTEIATTVSRETGKEICVAKVEEVFLDKLFEGTEKGEYESYLGWLGEEVTLLIGDKKQRASLVGVDDAGALVVKTEKGVEKFASAEISVRV